MSAITLRQATVQDLPQLVPLFDAYRRFYGQASDTARGRDFLFERLSRHESTVLLALDKQGSALGFAQIYPTYSSVRCKHAWILNDLYVVAAERGRGVATELINHAIQMARAHGVDFITLETAAANHQARQLYERLGFVRETEFLSYTFRT
ncbi:MAG: GNAT family N-acetyltransferase [Hylemonella sp.]|uniref:GNAT family N-acetyltransferase n=1 Tax=Hylemonella sp. TaxID=2066020 RepID=UPI0022CC9AC5|nr:GNAT family N-acetyltransferase [Hylemonella sp.]MCZ8251191.1 GNAT family N-acetyltransferase [Hylemonella sp.]